MALVVTAHYAQGIRDTQTFSKQDPYVKIMLLPGGAEYARCKQHRSGGVHPKWSAAHNNVMHLPLRNSGVTCLRIELWNDNLISDDFIGFVEVDIATYVGREPVLGELSLQPKGVVCVTISHLAHDEVGSGAGFSHAAGGCAAADTALRGGSSTQRFTNTAARLGGTASVDGASAREMAAAAAERRAASAAGKGGAASAKAAATRREKQILAGKIEAYYAARGEDAPFGLMASSTDVLRRHLRSLISDNS